ncbi:NLGNY-like protein [Mya arenaria]|uniref:NLGNY-like protein n=1 Tax=Mya arenaria TaxID=6604 RepID=A0ABY7EHF9_MYAAR|nr:NLGNY-like protein [Mya arenaria]
MRFLHGITYNTYTDVGTIIGSINELTFKGQSLKYIKYLGIPYSETSSSETRFLKLKLRERFVRPYNASEFKPSCVQNGYKNLKYLTSEDCLFLNIYAPIESTINPKRKFPVVIYFHGGSFKTGASNVVSPEILAVAGDLIFVTVNYRLGILGFLNSDNEYARGNYGLWDQQLAIRWIRYNIASFGGDVKKITLMGHEAGAASAMFQALYPGNRGLFQRVIAMSGSATSPWALHGPNVREIAKELGCFDDARNFTFSDQPLVECIKDKKVTEILQVQEKFSNIGPTTDGDFLVDHPLRIIKTGKDNITLNDSFSFFRSLDVSIGVTESDGSQSLLELLAEEFGESGWNFGSIKADEFEHIIIPDILKIVYKNHELFINRSIDNFTRSNLKYSVMFQYTNWTDPENVRNVQNNLVRLATDANFVIPVVTMADAHSYTNYNSSTYVYEFSFLPSYLRADQTRVYGAAHGSELLPIFGYQKSMIELTGVKEEELTATDYELSENMMIWISNFAATGDPNKPIRFISYKDRPIHWPQYSNDRPYMRLIKNLTSVTSLGTRFGEPATSFWTTLVPVLLESAKANNNMRPKTDDKLVFTALEIKKEQVNTTFSGEHYVLSSTLPSQVNTTFTLPSQVNTTFSGEHYVLSSTLPSQVNTTFSGEHYVLRSTLPSQVNTRFSGEHYVLRPGANNKSQLRLNVSGLNFGDINHKAAYSPSQDSSTGAQKPGIGPPTNQR